MMYDWVPISALIFPLVEFPEIFQKPPGGKGDSGRRREALCSCSMILYGFCDGWILSKVLVHDLNV